MNIIFKEKKSQRYKRIVSFLPQHCYMMVYVRVNIVQCLVKFFNSAFLIKEFVMKNPNKLKVPKGHRLIFRASKKDKNGNTIYAKDYGLRGFPIVIPR
ncbi:hypothetical protein B9T19_03515 [Ignatzschineria sp. F8392]|nr:hypothetical protein B9T19_03515 [Ignatzschineria sp. F8392]